MDISPILDKNSHKPPQGFLQSRFWAEFKGNFGWSCLRFLVKPAETDQAGIQLGLSESASYELAVLIRKLMGPFTFAYVPHGPEIKYQPELSQDHLVRLGSSLKLLLPRSCMFIRFDPGWYSQGGETAVPKRPTFDFPLIKAADVQPPDTVVDRKSVV